MDKNHLKDGKIIFPDKLKIPKQFKVGLIGSGKIAEEYIKIIRSFNHSLSYIYSETNNNNAIRLAKKYKAKLIQNLNMIKMQTDVDFWIVCTSWNRLRNFFFTFININKPVLFEKSLILNLSDFKKVKKKTNIKSINKNISFAYNRNYYDYIFFLTSKLNNNKISYGSAYLYDPYKRLIKNKKISKKYLNIYITSHWISLILKIFKLCKLKIKKIIKNDINKNLKFRKITFHLTSNKNKFNFDLFNFPNLPKNHQINFFLEKQVIEISPIEKLTINHNLQKIKYRNQNKYLPKIETIEVSNKFKPGFRFQYYDFINKNFFNKKSQLITDLDELFEVYKILKILKHNENTKY